MRITVILMLEFSTLCIAQHDFNYLHHWLSNTSYPCGSLSLVYYKFSEAPILLFETEDTENVSIADYPEPVMNKWFVITAK